MPERCDKQRKSASFSLTIFLSLIRRRLNRLLIGGQILLSPNDVYVYFVLYLRCKSFDNRSHDQNK